MTVSRKLLVEGERVILVMRTHVKVLLLPTLVLLVTCALGGFLLATTRDGSASGVLQIVILAVAVVILVWWTVLPFLRWLTWTYTLTNLRLIEQKGLLTRRGRVIPLSRVNDVSFEKSLSDRLLGCGTLIVHDASEQSGLRVHDVPDVEDVHRTMTDLVFDSHDQSAVGRGDDEQA